MRLIGSTIYATRSGSGRAADACPEVQEGIEGGTKERIGRAARETLVRKRYGPKQADKSTKHQ
jgi:hypothetical protein